MKNSLIWTLDNSLDSDLCDEIISKFESDSRKMQGIAGYKVRPEMKKSMDLLIPNTKDWEEIANKLNHNLWSNLNHYYDYIDSLVTPFPLIPPFKNHGYELSSMIEGSDTVFNTGHQIQKTNPGEYYQWHHDNILEVNESKNVIPRLRIITYIWYLNDIEFDGYTEFITGEKIQPKKGRLLFFPSTWGMFHRGYPPKSETKYICTGWIWYSVKSTIVQ